MNILIVEDEKIQRQALASIIEKNFIDVKVYQAATQDEAIKQIAENEISLFFLDINLNGKSGLALAEKIRDYDQHKLTGIVFVTGEVVHIIEAFKKVHCYDFIVKPFKEQDIKQIVSVFLNNSPLRTKRQGRYTFIEIDSNLSVKLYHEDIIYIQYINKCCNIYTINGVYTFKRSSLSKLVKMFNDENIVQTHQAFAVNVDYVTKIEKAYEKIWNINLKSCNDIILLSYTYRQALLGRLEKWN